MILTLGGQLFKKSREADSYLITYFSVLNKTMIQLSYETETRWVILKIHENLLESQGLNSPLLFICFNFLK